MPLRLLTPLVRKLRSLTANWSRDTDREFDEKLFTATDHDPFTFAYVGYTTIRRFAELASPIIERNDARTVLDLGCRAGQITCELAALHPKVQFVGVDHSAAGARRAEENRLRKGVDNLSFVVADAETFTPEAPVDVVMMFDSFHHLTDPAAFVRRAAGFSERFLLIEPRGDWAGRWQKDLELDWLPLELEKIRALLAVAVNEPPPPPAEPGSQPRGHGDDGEAIEHRYSIDELQRFFDGFALDIRGTVAGLEKYSPKAWAVTPSRERFGRLSYQLFGEVDEQLRASDRDLLAKHWVIEAEPGAARPLRQPPVVAQPDRSSAAGSGDAVRGGYDVHYRDYDGPVTVAVGAELRPTLEVDNRSFRTLSSADGGDGDPQVFVSYHWRDRKTGETVVQDGIRTPLPRPLAPEQSVRVSPRIIAPERPGRYSLAFDLVEEGVAWFSDTGIPCLEIAIEVRSSN